MFGFFKKKNTLSELEYKLLFNVTSVLPSRYSYLHQQVNREFLLGRKQNPLSEKGTNVLLLNAALEKQYANKKLPQFFIIRNIKVWNNAQEAFVDLELHILDGMLAGYKLLSTVEDIDLNQVDGSNAIEKHFNNADKETAVRILGDSKELVETELDLNDSYKISLTEGDFFTIKFLGDGNYLAVNKLGQVFLLIHDPYVVKKIYDDVHLLKSEIENGYFQTRIRNDLER